MNTEDGVALLIDGENISPKRYREIHETASRYGTVKIQQVVGDWTLQNMRGWLSVTRSCGLTEIHQANLAKNSADIRLAIEATTLVTSRPDVSVMVIVSCDGGFATLCGNLKDKGKYVVGVGLGHSPLHLRLACSNFHVLEKKPFNSMKISNQGGGIQEVKEPN